MKRKPRSLFKDRKRGDVLHIGPQFVGRPPNYQAEVERKGEQLAGQLPPGVYMQPIYHDSDCSIYDGGACDCDAEVGDPIPVCEECGGTDFMSWVKADDPDDVAITCKKCGAVFASTKGLDPSDRPIRVPRTPPDPGSAP
jgi:hypothetical protein